jgi:hypothetical protein
MPTVGIKAATETNLAMPLTASDALEHRDDVLGARSSNSSRESTGSR